MNLETAIIEFATATQNLKAAMDQEYSQYREENAYRHLQLKFMAIISIQHFKPLPKALLDLVWALWMRPNSKVVYKELTLLPGGKDDFVA